MRHARQQGFTYLAILFMVAFMGTALAATGVLWSTQQQRDKERELLFIGNQFRAAIANYYERSPGTVKRYPAAIDELLNDLRFLQTRRHLRRIYQDPITGKSEWGIVRAPDGGIMGVYSLSTDAPLKHALFAIENSEFSKAKQYQDWRFVYEPPIDMPPPAPRP